MNTCSHCANLKSSIESYPICDDPLPRSARCCLVPRPQFFARPKRFGSRGPSENVPQIRHRSELTKRDWENAVQVFVQGLGRARCSIAPLQKPRQSHCFCEQQTYPILFSCNPRIIWNKVYVDRVLPFTSVLKIRVFYFFSALCFHGSWIQDHSLLWKESRI